MRKFDEVECDATGFLGPGVYVLWAGGKVAFMGWAKGMMERVCLHMQHAHMGAPRGMPRLVEPVKFSRVTYVPCPSFKAKDIMARLAKEYSYDRAA